MNIQLTEISGLVIVVLRIRICYLPVLDGEVGEKLEEHESAVDVFVVGAGARPRTPVQDEQLVHFTGNLPKALTLNT